MNFKPQTEEVANKISEKFGFHIPQEKYPEMEKLITAHRPLKEMDGVPLNFLKPFLIHETYFFRDPDQFKVLASFFNLWLEKGENSIEILSAGCSTGEEVFSIAMTLGEIFSTTRLHYQITGVDLSEESLIKARAGIYKKWSLRSLPQENFDTYFDSERDQFRVKQPFLDGVTFTQGNIADPHEKFWKKGSYGVVFFRNVMMYFSPKKGIDVINNIYDSLKPGGLLFLGHAETLRTINHPFELETLGNSFYYRKPFLKVYSFQKTKKSENLNLYPDFSPPGNDHWFEKIQESSLKIQKLLWPEIHKKFSPEGENNQPKFKTENAMDRVLELFKFEKFLILKDYLPQVIDKLQSWEWLQILFILIELNLGNVKKASAAAQIFCKKGGDDPRPFYILFLINKNQQNHREAGEFLQKSLNLGENFFFAWHSAGYLERENRKYEQAILNFKHSLYCLEFEEEVSMILFGGGFPRKTYEELIRGEIENLTLKAHLMEGGDR